VIQTDAIARGSRVLLRLATEKDLADYERWSNPSLPAWQFDGPWFNDDHSVMLRRRQKWLKSNPQPPHSFLEIDTTDGVHIGWVCVYHDEHDPHMTEVGIDLPEDTYWGQGLGTEALRLWIDYLFETRYFTRIGFSTWSGNPGAIGIGCKLGFRLEATIRNGCQVRGKFYDRIKMGILKREWDREMQAVDDKKKSEHDNKD